MKNIGDFLYKFFINKNEFIIEIEQKYDLNTIKKRYNMEEKLNFSFFYGGYYSQWFPSKMRINNISYCNCEQYMMSKKADLFGDIDIFNKIMNETNPKVIKNLGKKVKNFDEKVWDKVKYSIVFVGNYYKFKQNETLRKHLLNDNKIIVEASPYDKIWGIGLGKDNPIEYLENPNNWKGQNLLGFAIMHVRDYLLN